MLTAFGLVAASTMVIAYGMEERNPMWVAVFAVACLATALYGVLTEAWVFAVLETIWSALALNRFSKQRRQL